MYTSSAYMMSVLSNQSMRPIMAPEYVDVRQKILKIYSDQVLDWYMDNLDNQTHKGYYVPRSQ